MEENEIENLIDKIVEDKIEEIKLANIEAPVKKRLNRDERHAKKIAAIVGLLSPLIVVPNNTDNPYVRYIIEDEHYRLQLQDALMIAHKKHYK